MSDEYLREMLPISKGANTIFRQIFAYEASERITIPELRRAIIDLDTFFMTDGEIACASHAVRVAASHCGVQVRPAGVAAKATDHVSVATPRPEQVMDASASGATSASDASSNATDSDGPVTPSVNAQDPKLAIPEFELEHSELGHSGKKLHEVVDLCGLGIIHVGAQMSEVPWCG